MAENPKDFPDEFAKSLLKAFDDKSVWFGRMVAFGYEIKGFLGKDYTEDIFRKKLINGTLTIASIKVSNVAVSGLTVTGKMEIAGKDEGTEFKQAFDFEHQLKRALHVKKTTLTL